MLIFIYGEDEYRAFLKQKERMQDFFKKYPANINWRIFDFSETPQDEFRGQAESLDEFKNFIGSSSMFSENKLAVISHLSQFKNFDAFKNLIDKYDLEFSSDAFLLIREGDLSEKSRQQYLDFLREKAKEVHKFDKLSGAKLAAWVFQEVKKSGGAIDNGAVLRLTALFKSDTRRLAKEIEKLIAYKAEEKIQKTDVFLACGDGFREEKIFTLMDEIFAGRKKEAILIFERLIATEDEDFIFNQIVGQIRNLIKIKFGAKDAKFHPFYIKKMTEAGHFHGWEKIRKMYEELAKIDVLVKTGKIGYKEGIEDFIIKINE